MPTRVRALVCAATAAAALAVSACGGGGGVGSDDPASLAPADAPIYIQALLRPHGRLKADTEGLASSISGETDPTGRLIELLDQSLREDESKRGGKRLTFAKDIDPWLGGRAGLFVEGFENDPPAAAVVQATDPDAAQRFVADAKEEGDKDRSYQGIDYVADGEDGTAAGLVDDFLVVGDQKAFKDAVDVSEGDASLGDAGEFTDTLDRAPSGSLTDAYFSVEAIADSVRAQDPDSAKGLEGSIGDTSGKTALASLVPKSDSLELDLSTDAGQGLQFADLSELIGTFPRTSFAAAGIPGLGELVNRVVDQLERAGVPGISREAIDQQLQAAGLSLDEITGPLGDLGIFAEGTSRSLLQGAGVITTDDPSGARDLLGRLTDLALRSGQGGISRARVGTGLTISDPQDLGPQPLTITALDDRIAIAYGQKALAQSFPAAGQAKLSDDPSFKQAVKALGGADLSGYVALGPVFKLAESLGASADSDYRQAKPYLQRLSYAVLGSGKEGELSTTKVIIGVQR